MNMKYMILIKNILYSYAVFYTPLVSTSTSTLFKLSLSSSTDMSYLSGNSHTGPGDPLHYQLEHLPANHVLIIPIIICTVTITLGNPNSSGDEVV